MAETPIVRQAVAADAHALGRLGALLMQAHYAFDPQRFLAAGREQEAGYGAFLRSQLASDDSLVLVAEAGGRIVGYVFAGLEPLSWKELRGPAGFIHDLFVDDQARQSGAGTLLLEAAIAWLRDRGAPRVVLWTAEQNAGAQRLFARQGFRRTMVEMTREL